MNTQPTTQKTGSFDMVRIMALGLLFVAMVGLLFLGLRQDDVLETELQKLVYPLGMALVLASLAVVWLWMQTADNARHSTLSPFMKRWSYPIISFVLGLFCMVLAYSYLGMWPIGERSAMTVDMHHQYAPLLADLRNDLLSGDFNLFYSFNVGLGTGYLPLFGYYLASPFNLLLTLFPEHLLTEGILVITLLKNALSAAFFAACIQYVYKKRNAAIPAMAIMYSLMMYLLAYSWNIMWLDVIMMLPLVVMLFERMMRTGKYLGYILGLAYALFANYYIAFMMCIFLVLYFVVWAMRKRRTGSEIGRAFGKFALTSAIGGGLVMALLVPVYIGLGQTSAAGSDLPEMKANFAFFDLLGQHLFRSVPTIRSGNLPNIYCGLLPVVLVPLFATTKTISPRRRLAYGGLLAVLAFSFVLNQFDLVWHGLHSPNDLPYRFSFLYSFVLLLIAYETLLHLKDITKKQIGCTVGGLFLYLILVERFGNAEKITFDNVYVSMLMIGIYAVIITMIACKKWTLRPAYMFLTLVVTAEMVLNAGFTMRQLHANEHFTAHESYVDNEITSSLHEVVEETKRIGNMAHPDGFYRMEFLPRRTTVDPALFNYHGMTVFASSNPYNTVKFMGNVGYAINGVNSYLYKSFVAPIDSLMGINYVVLDSYIAGHPQLQEIGSTQTGTTTHYIYENPYALSLGYMVDPAIRQWIPTQYDPITSQNNLFRRLTGLQDDLYTIHPVEVARGSTDVASVRDNATCDIENGFSLSGSDMTAYFTVDIPKEGQAVIYVDCRAAEDLSASVNGNHWNITTHEPFLIDAGKLEIGDQVEVMVKADSSCVGSIYVATLNEDVFHSSMEILSKNELDITSFSDTRIEGTVTADKDGIMMTTLTYDAGWKVLVDGKEVTPVSTQMKAAADTGTVGMAEALLCFEVPAGTHTVTLEFTPEGWHLGLMLSGVSFLFLILMLVWTKWSKKIKSTLSGEEEDIIPYEASEKSPATPLETDDMEAEILFAPVETPPKEMNE